MYVTELVYENQVRSMAGGCLRLSVLSTPGRKRKAPLDYKSNEANPMPEQQKISLLIVINQSGGFMRRSYMYCLMVICFTILIFVWIVRGTLCELHIRKGSTELTAYLAYEVEPR